MTMKIERKLTFAQRRGRYQYSPTLQSIYHLLASSEALDTFSIHERTKIGFGETLVFEHGGCMHKCPFSFSSAFPVCNRFKPKLVTNFSKPAKKEHNRIPTEHDNNIALVIVQKNNNNNNLK